MNDSLVLATERLQLRPLAPVDAPRIQLLAGDEAVSATALGIPYPLTAEDASVWVQEAQTGWASGRDYVFALIDKAEGIMIGSAALTVNPESKRADLGYWLGRAWWGQGYATEAASRLIQFGFEELRLNRIYANHNGGNFASGRVMQKIGMKYEGTLREHVWHRGRFVDLIYYGLLRSEYEALARGDAGQMR